MKFFGGLSALSDYHSPQLQLCLLELIFKTLYHWRHFGQGLVLREFQRGYI